MDTLANMLMEDEGYSESLYLDVKGNLTGGYGHRFKVGYTLSAEIWEAIFKHDVARAINSYMRLPRSKTDHLNPARKRVIVSMIFNLGLSGCLNFERMWVCIERDDFEGAAREMLWNGPGRKTRWYSDVGTRAERLALIMEEG